MHLETENNYKQINKSVNFHIPLLNTAFYRVTNGTQNIKPQQMLEQKICYQIQGQVRQQSEEERCESDSL